jgi:uncharacterized protein (AIM24 family)
MRYTLLKGPVPSLRVHLQPQEALYADADVARSCSGGITEKRKIQGRLMRGLKRKILTGRGPFLTEYLACGEAGQIDLCTGKSDPIVPVTLHRQAILCRRDSFLAFHGDLDLDVVLAPPPAGLLSFFRSGDIILQKISGSGTVFIHAGGYLVDSPLRLEELMSSPAAKIPFVQAPARFSRVAASRRSGASALPAAFPA